MLGSLKNLQDTLGLSSLKPDGKLNGTASIQSLPFGLADVTAGTENELQAVVTGARSNVDLPVTIERSKYFANIARRVAHDEAPPRLAKELNRFLHENKDQVWENSWVRFPRKSLSALANQLLDDDLSGRADENGRSRFVFGSLFGDWVRLPISYLVKLALVDVVGTSRHLPSRVNVFLSTAVALHAFIRKTIFTFLTHDSNQFCDSSTL